ncbi:hypothetical protein MRX96_035042 [Rhipicephalus microplus]
MAAALLTLSASLLGSGSRLSRSSVGVLSDPSSRSLAVVDSAGAREMETESLGESDRRPNEQASKKSDARGPLPHKAEQWTRKRFDEATLETSRRFLSSSLFRRSGRPPGAGQVGSSRRQQRAQASLRRYASANLFSVTSGKERRQERHRRKSALQENRDAPSAQKMKKRAHPPPLKSAGSPEQSLVHVRARQCARARFSAFLCTTATPLAGRPDEAVLRSPASPVCALHPLGNVALYRWSGAVAALQQGAECVPALRARCLVRWRENHAANTHKRGSCSR